ncbi:phosphotransferase family protein [Streptomyces tauricus]|uniref:phosphotransferase family protein n=1 Tax=Streptomyces tauricus TaxID=68274 RepID=UPI00387F2AAC
MAEGERTVVVATDVDDTGWPATRAWVEEHLPSGDRIRAVATLRGGWTSRMRRLDIEDGDAVVEPQADGRGHRATDRVPGPAAFLHRDFHPGNVLFGGEGAAMTITGLVDWVETSWGPADLDVAHCSSALALLHGVPAGMRLAAHYTAAGGTLSDGQDHQYWRVLDALAFAPDAAKVAEPWRELGREDLTPSVLTERLESYLEALFDGYG